MALIDKETFDQLVKNPALITADVIPQLEATIKAFPYCQIPYSILAKASSLAGTEKLEETRPRAAAYALSRVALQQLVESDNERYDATVDVDDILEPQVTPEPLDSDDILISTVEQQASAELQRTEEQRRQQQIIQGFMKKNPRIARQDNNLEPLNIDLSSRLAGNSDSGIETEAFAKILIRQGKIEKAIDVYQKLILKKPEKRNYFAKKLSELYARA
ncbi:hypothetical protein [Dyadobacter fermentans]|uniref:Tetratricopeptide repeat protein n=1 Tax=Dyadobacter fermentans (strain ATCC 700827 / DSM 18053 / CIP 107007 / KCTC 52180 / NS114) TaxID=471854 RepID=C6W3G8_DYAFD|nr:hypothetical protein [Dyadobacter fermentans]ACT93945.1 hypothetical protein Dfer_2730 [Dyadobacter fermentans DSM 18053]